MSDSNSTLDPCINQVKNILYLDGNDDDQLLSSYVIAADAFVHNAVGEDVNGFYADSAVKALMATAIESLAATYYQNRLALSDTQTFAVDLTLDSIIGQLRGMRNGFEEKSDSNADANKPAQSSN